MSVTRALAGRLSPDARRRVRRATDGVLAPVGSIRGARTGERVLALTYDDGPEPGDTDAVLAALAEAGIQATFFVLVYRAEAHPELIRRTIAAGHEVALHGIDHSRLTELPAPEVSRVLATGKARLERIAGQPVRLFRPAYGSQTVRTYLAARRAGLDVVVWGPTAADWRDGPAGEVAERALAGVAPGEIMLLHDAFEVPPGDQTPRPTFDRGDVTRALLAGLADRDYTPLPVGRLLSGRRPWRTAWYRP
ncbi:MAG TPA: polysaccharide deacetylase family protein [Mycobacteriales bacterium]|nr:polysaccharide deacetylase family protein [Mycobacteriales bacterium]